MSRICLVYLSRICPEYFMSGICWVYLSRICPENFMYKKNWACKKFRTAKQINFLDIFMTIFEAPGQFPDIFVDIFRTFFFRRVGKFQKVSENYNRGRHFKHNIILYVYSNQILRNRGDEYVKQTIKLERSLLHLKITHISLFL